MSAPMDNFSVRVVGAWTEKGDDDLLAVVKLVFNHHSMKSMQSLKHMFA